MERKARIDRGDRDLESEVGASGVRHDLGKCDLTPLWGENAPRARLITVLWKHFGPSLSSLRSTVWTSGKFPVGGPRVHGKGAEGSGTQMIGEHEDDPSQEPKREPYT